MQRRDNLAHLILAGVVVLVLAQLMVYLDAHAQIVFISRRDGNREIYVMDADGGNQQRLTNNPHGDWRPSWSPDGKHIVFVSERDGNREIYVMDADGGNPQNLTNNPHGDSNPSWSPDGKRIVFSSNRDGHVIAGIPTYEIYVMDADGGNQQRLTNNRHNDDHPSWSPDGKRIVFDARRNGHFRNDLWGITSEIYVMDTDGRNQLNLTNNRSNDWSPSWSPDGKRIVFTMSDENGTEIYVMDADGRNQLNLTNNRSNDRWSSWSPNGKRIAFASDRDRPPDFDIYVMDADGSNPQNLTNNPQLEGHPAWFGPTFAVAPARETLTIWGRLKQANR